MARIPAMRKDPIPYRSRNTSSRINQMQEDIFFDLMQLFTELNQQKQKIQEQSQVVTTENKFLQMRLMQLEDELARLSELLEQQKLQNGQPVTITAFVSDFQGDSDAIGVQQASLDQLHRVATLPPAGAPVSKVFLTDALTGETFAPAMTKVEVEPAAVPGSITDINLRGLVDGKDHSVWVRKVQLPLSNPATEVTATVTITLPDNILSSRDVNLITIHPFPGQSVDVVDVEYRLDGAWKRIPGFNPVNEAGPLKLCFPPIQIHQVRVTFRQRHWLEEHGQKVFYLGGQEIGIYSQSFAAQKASLQIPITLPGPGPFKITAIEPEIVNRDALSDRTPSARSVFSYSLYTLDAKGNPIYTQDQLPITVKSPVSTQPVQLLLKATLNIDAATQTTPALAAVKVVYQPV